MNRWLSATLVFMLVVGSAPTVFAESIPTAELTALLREFHEHSGASLVFRAEDLPPGTYHDSMPTLESRRQIAAARIALAEVRKLPKQYLAQVGLKTVGVFHACVSRKGDGFRPYDDKLKGYRYFGIWNGRDALAAAYYSDEQLPLTLHHEMFHHIDASTGDEKTFELDDRFSAAVEGVRPYPAIQLSDEELSALRSASRAATLEEAVSEYCKKSVGEDKAETARHFMSHLPDALLQAATRPELPGSQRLLHVLATYAKANQGNPGDTSWFVAVALNRTAESKAAARLQIAFARSSRAENAAEIREALSNVKTMDLRTSPELTATVLKATVAMLRAELTPRAGDSEFTVRGHEDANGVNWTLRRTLSDCADDASRAQALVGEQADQRESLARAMLQNLRLLSRFHEFIAGRWTITPATDALFDQAKTALLKGLPVDRASHAKQVATLSYAELATAIRPDGSIDESLLRHEDPTNEYLPKVDEAIADPAIRAAIRRVQPACLKVNGASGVNISPKGRALTNAHVADRIGATMWVEFPDGRRFSARCTKIDVQLDLAICDFAGDNLPFAAIAAKAPQSGTSVTCIGQPGARTPDGAATRYQPFHVSTGEIRGYLEDPLGEQSLGRLKHDAWTYWGHSGSPLFDDSGRIVGLHNSWDSTTAMRHGVPLQAIAKFLKGIEPR